MPRFRFRLQAVLEQREARERERQREVAAVERERGAVEDRLRVYQDQIRAERDALRDALGRDRSGRESVDLGQVRTQAAAGLRLISEAQRAANQLVGVGARLDAARLELLRAAIRRKAVEALRDRQARAWRAAEERRESNAIDELAVMNAARRRGPHASDGAPLGSDAA